MFPQNNPKSLDLLIQLDMSEMDLNVIFSCQVGILI